MANINPATTGHAAQRPIFYLIRFDEWIYNPQYDPIEMAATARLRQRQADELDERLSQTEILDIYWPPEPTDDPIARYREE